MRRLIRLLHYLRRYIPQLLIALPLAAGVGAADAFRLLLIGPILDRVLRPDAGSHAIVLARLPGTHYTLYLQQFVPEHFKNAWTMVAFAMVMATLVKGICDYASTYLVYYAGFGLITDLRNDLYNAILRRSVGFFSRYSTGTLLSTIVNDVERIQIAMGSVLAESL
ncbi:MAG: ABC transporter transmembrane domain-containing protein, partial [Terriglobales bacterium]